MFNNIASHSRHMRGLYPVRVAGPLSGFKILLPTSGTFKTSPQYESAGASSVALSVRILLHIHDTSMASPLYGYVGVPSGANY